MLTSEQEHLDRSRAALARMRERTAATDASGGDRWSNEYLKEALWRRMKALEDDPDVPLFFGRLDYAGGAGSLGAAGERFYVGRRHVSDERGDPMVVDWRAPVSRPFYRAGARDAMGVSLRRRFGFVHGAITAYEDEKLGDDDRDAAASQILADEIERPRVGPMRDIVATIQPEQDDIVRAPLTRSVCVQGAPGTGKTAVGLHRAAYLLYAHRDQLTRQGVMVVGPNDSFLRYIGDVLPALGEIDAKQATVESLVGHVRIRAVDPGPVARIKGDARMAEVVRRALWEQVGAATETLVVPRGARKYRVPAYQVDEIVADLKSRGVRYAAARTMLPQRLAHTVLVKMEDAGEAPDDRDQSAVARSRPVKMYVDALWPVADPKKLIFRLLSDSELLARAAEGLLTSAEQELVLWPTVPRSPGSATWSVHDAVLVDEARDLLDRTPSLGHVVLDEAQDLSPMMLRAVGRYCSTGSATVLGDLAQATTTWAAGAWATALGHLGRPEAAVEELTLGFRVPGEVIDLAARLLPTIAPTLATPTAVRRDAGDLELRRVKASRLVAGVVEAVEVASQRLGSVGVIVPDAAVRRVTKALDTAGVSFGVLGGDDAALAPDTEVRVDVAPASLAKGLEFDHVVLMEPSAIVAAESEAAGGAEVVGLRRLYVCLTRAVTSLVVVHADELPGLLNDAQDSSDSASTIV